MKYNIDFLIAALIFLLLILYHYTSRRQLDSENNKVFLVFVLIGIADIFFDILCTVLISWENPGLVGLTKACLTILYMLQITVPYALRQYTQSLRSMRRMKLLDAWIVLPGIMLCLIIANIRTGIFFYFDDVGNYTRGSMYMYMYYYAMLFVLVIVIESVYYYKELGAAKFRVIWEFLLLAGICVVVQAYSNDLLVTGFGIALGIVILFLTINNPYEYTDNLTGLFDGQYFSEWVSKDFQKDRTFHVFSVDLFRLKQINKVMGNSFGDKMLVRIANELYDISNMHYVFRVGGNRFLILTHSLSEYEKIRDELLGIFNSEMDVDQERIALSAILCGILNAQKLEDQDTLLGYIEYLVSLAPVQGETILIQGDDETLTGFNYTKTVECFLKTAIEEDLFEIYLQPIYSAKEEEFVGAEVLSRLRHPTLGQVPPSIFVEIAEKNGQIREIGYMQFRKVCKFVKEHEEIMGKLRNIKVNLSPAELLRRGYGEMILDTIAEFDLKNSYFQFEITETVATEYSAQLYRTIENFNRAGIEFCLDDFGSGYANLDTVLKLPFSTIKLDRSLLSGTSADSQREIFYQSIVTIFLNMGYKVIAEGVETDTEKALVHRCGVDLIQGFGYARPMSIERFLRFIS